LPAENHGTLAGFTADISARNPHTPAHVER
jgi:hypothetical protein